MIGISYSDGNPVENFVSMTLIAMEYDLLWSGLFITRSSDQAAHCLAVIAQDLEARGIPANTNSASRQVKTENSMARIVTYYPELYDRLRGLVFQQVSGLLHITDEVVRKRIEAMLRSSSDKLEPHLAWYL